MTLIYYINLKITPDHFNCTHLLNPEITETSNSFKSYNDKKRFIFGRLLIRRMLVDYGFKSTILNELKYDLNERPYLNEGIDFNISHSQDIVIGIISDNAKVGIDIEIIDKKSINELKDIVFNENELKHFNQVNDKVKYFFDVWTTKEALLKAVGVGLKASLQEINTLDEMFYYDKTHWIHKKINLFSEYSCSAIYSNISQSNIKIKNLIFQDLLL